MVREAILLNTVHLGEVGEEEIEVATEQVPIIAPYIKLKAGVKEEADLFIWAVVGGIFKADVGAAVNAKNFSSKSGVSLNKIAGKRSRTSGFYPVGGGVSKIITIDEVGAIVDKAETGEEVFSPFGIAVGGVTAEETVDSVNLETEFIGIGWEGVGEEVDTEGKDGVIEGEHNQIDGAADIDFKVRVSRIEEDAEFGFLGIAAETDEIPAAGEEGNRKAIPGGGGKQFREEEEEDNRVKEYFQSGNSKKLIFVRWNIRKKIFVYLFIRL